MNSMFLRDLIRNCYACSLVTLLFYGYFSMKPAALATASTLTAASAGRGINDRFASKPLRRALDTQSRELQSLYAQVELLKQALQENYQWHERFKFSDSQLQEIQQVLKTTQIRLDEFESANALYEIESKVWQEKAKAQMEPLKGEIERLKQACKHYQGMYEQSSGDYSATVDRNAELVAQIEYLKLQLQVLMAPRRLNGELPEQKMADEIANWFGRAQVPIQLSVESASISGQDWQTLFTFKNTRDRNRIQEFAGWLQNDFSLAEVPTIKVIDERVRITIHRGEMNNESRYLKVDPSWLKAALVLSKGGKLETHHARFQGSTECGKSTLVSNAIGCLIQSIPMVEIVLADPLLKGKTQWKTLTPNYKGEDSSVAGFMEFYQEYKAIDEGKQEIGNTKVFILDEFDKVIVKHPKLIPLMLEIWKSGRQYERYLWVISQSALVGKFGLNMEDMDNLIGFYLGKTLERGFIDSNEDPGYISRLRQEWHTTKARSISFVCLVRPHTVNNRPFLAKMPAPGHYSIGVDAVAVAEQVQEEERLDYYAAEFDIGNETVEQLNNLFKQPSEPVQPTPSNLNPVTVKVIDLHLKKMKPHQIVKEIWGIPASKSANYQQKKAQVEQIIRDYETGST